MKKFLMIAAVAALGFSCSNNESDDMTDYTIKTITFEDESDSSYWADLIDSSQYGGELLYNNTTGYVWTDENTTLTGGMVGENFWSGGVVISNYASTDYSAVDYDQQLLVPFTENKGGYNGSKNFAISYCYGGFSSNVIVDYMPNLYFSDNSTHVIDHLYVAPTSYLLSVLCYGDYYAGPYDSDEFENETVTFVVVGYDIDQNMVGEVSIDILNEEEGYLMTSWTKMDLSSLGEVYNISMYVTGNQTNEYGPVRPAYAAIDNIAIRISNL